MYAVSTVVMYYDDPIREIRQSLEAHKAFFPERARASLPQARQHVAPHVVSGEWNRAMRARWLR